MSGSILRRTVLSLVLVALLLPLASAHAAPARAREEARIQLPEWSRILLAPISGLMDLFRPVTAADSWPPGQRPGNGDPQSADRDGNGLDPHGRP
jgi:hypothetical protein